jgi:hypothetical protein
VAAGRYQLIATRGGYVQVAHGQRRAFERGRPVTLAAGQVLEGIDFSLVPGAVVTGRILDEVGEPVAGVHVSLARDGFVQDGRRLVSRHGASTDDRGRYRIFGVAPGDYVLLVVASDLGGASTDLVRDVPTYYPGTASIAEAQWVTLASGQERAGFDMRLVRAQTAAIRGRLRTADNRPASPLAFVVAEALDPVIPYGIIHRSVAARTQEIGIRTALGATASTVAQMVLASGLWLAVTGLGIGLVGSLALSRTLSSFLYETSPLDPLIHAGVAILLLAVTTAATLIPARRAARIDPMAALRDQ